MRELTRRAHNTNIDLGNQLLGKLATVDPGEMNIARFFAYGLLGANVYRKDSTVEKIAAGGIRLVFGEHRKTTTPILKTGKKGKTKVAYGEVEDAVKWLWKFIDAAKSAGELYGRTLVVYASQHYAQQLVIPRTQRRHSALPSSHKDTAAKAFTSLTKELLPGTHVQLQRSLEREAREFTKRQQELDAAARKQHASDKQPAAETDEPAGIDEEEPQS